MAADLQLKPLEASPDAWRNVQQTVESNAFGTPTALKLKFSNGETETLTDYDDILANIMGSSQGERFRQFGAFAGPKWVHQAGDPKRSFPYKLGANIKSILSSDNPVHRFLERGALPAGAAGAGLGALTNAALAAFDKSPLLGNPWMLPAITGLLGAGIGHISASAAENKKAREAMLSGEVEKSAAMYRDPRNFILEKLLAAKDVPLAMKASLAESVRRMDIDAAEELAADVRAAVGFGVGNLIAEYFETEAAFNGMGDTLAPTILNNLAEKLLNNQ